MLPPRFESAPLDEFPPEIIGSLSFSDVDESDIWEWLAGNPDVRGITPVGLFGRI